MPAAGCQNEALQLGCEGMNSLLTRHKNYVVFVTLL
jgi:hypothetical protein